MLTSASEIAKEKKVYRTDGPNPHGSGDRFSREGPPHGIPPVQMPPPPRMAATPDAQPSLPGPPPLQSARGAPDSQEGFPLDEGRDGMPQQQSNSQGRGSAKACHFSFNLAVGRGRRAWRIWQMQSTATNIMVP